ncbi:ATP-binding cassette domain-containing protein [Pseudoxanthomonas sp. NC8]|nr:ATP-binding cassette domain-containing protein [Pseudoxanthomonas sp. NC8]
MLGANGCGKSTLIKLITRELYPLARAAGEPPVRVLGQGALDGGPAALAAGDRDRRFRRQPYRHARAHGRGRGAQRPVRQLRGPAVPRDHRRHARARVEALDRAHALPLRGRPYAELSTGEARRVLIARALVNRPQALLLDEPGTGLDLGRPWPPAGDAAVTGRRGRDPGAGDPSHRGNHPGDRAGGAAPVRPRAGRRPARGSADRAWLSQAFGGPVRVWQERDPQQQDHYLAAAGS